MKLAIYVHGSEGLRQPSQSINQDYEGLSIFISNMRETMVSADGVGLAAPQVGYNICLFMVDLALFEDSEDMKNLNPALGCKIFINPTIISFSETLCTYKEGCLSVPDINEHVIRPDDITISYYDEQWVKHTDSYSGMWSRVIQHEYDHLEGRLFVDSISPLRKQMLSSKLIAISRGKHKAQYKTK